MHQRLLDCNWDEMLRSKCWFFSLNLVFHRNIWINDERFNRSAETLDNQDILDYILLDKLESQLSCL